MSDVHGKSALIKRLQRDLDELWQAHWGHKPKLSVMQRNPGAKQGRLGISDGIQVKLYVRSYSLYCDQIAVLVHECTHHAIPYSEDMKSHGMEFLRTYCWVAQELFNLDMTHLLPRWGLDTEAAGVKISSRMDQLLKSHLRRLGSYPGRIHLRATAPKSPPLWVIRSVEGGLLRVRIPEAMWDFASVCIWPIDFPTLDLTRATRTKKAWEIDLTSAQAEALYVSVKNRRWYADEGHQKGLEAYMFAYLSYLKGYLWSLRGARYSKYEGWSKGTTQTYLTTKDAS